MSKIKIFISALSVLLAAALPAEVIMKLDFDKDFNSGNLPLNGKVSGVSWRSTSDPHSFALVKTPAASKPHALKILRDGSSGRIVFSPQKAIAPMRNYSMQFKVYLVQGDGTVLHFHNGKQLLGGIHMASGSVMKAYNITQGWENNEGAPELPLEQWVAIRVNFDANRGFYTIDTALPGGKIHNGTTQFPFIVPGPVNEWHFLNILPQKNYAFVDDLLLTCDDSISLSGRTDFAPECTSGNAAFNRMLSGKAVGAAG